ncbi:porin [Paraburkholderia bannensis]|uniref:porin n=1 Tax=Paraburkholderia bannensis TaxID=765414 RepID=UPI002AB79E0A|nr:porin [Paraburkholderia bannensis]
MKKLVIASALSASAILAHAQSSVTLYGVIDEGLTFTNNSGGHQAYQMSSGYVAGSRWGLKGTEDLGGGLSAIFTLENGFDVNSGTNGQGGREFGRQAFVGMSSNQYGAVTLGRQYDSVVDYLAPLTANGAWAGYLFAHPYDNDNTDNSFRLNNTIKYASPSFGGLRFGGLYGFSNSTNFGNNRSFSLGASYAYGGLSAAAAYMKIYNPGGQSAGTLTNDADFTAAKQTVYGAAIAYSFQSARVGFAWSHTRFDSPTSTEYLSGSIAPASGPLGSLSFDNFEVNGRYQITPAVAVVGMYTYTKGHASSAAGTADPSWHTVGLMGDYSLSKRTDVYLQTVYQQKSGGSVGSALDYAAIPGASGASSSNRQVAVRLALMHSF